MMGNIRVAFKTPTISTKSPRLRFHQVQMKMNRINTERVNSLIKVVAESANNEEKAKLRVRATKSSKIFKSFIMVA